MLDLVPLETLLAFTSAGILLNLTPGADVMFATASGMAGGPRAGIAAGAGVGLGGFWHVGLAAIGVAALLAAHPAAMTGLRVGLADNWLRHVYDVKLRHRRRIDHLPIAQMEDVMCEMNVIEQVGNVAMSNVLLDAWARGQKISIHGWCYGLKDGLAKDLGVTMSNAEEVVDVFRAALKRYPRGVVPPR